MRGRIRVYTVCSYTLTQSHFSTKSILDVRGKSRSLGSSYRPTIWFSVPSDMLSQSSSFLSKFRRLVQEVHCGIRVLEGHIGILSLPCLKQTHQNQESTCLPQKPYNLLFIGKGIFLYYSSKVSTVTIFNLATVMVTTIGMENLDAIIFFGPKGWLRL